MVGWFNLLLLNWRRYAAKVNNRPALTTLDLFAGAGGLTLGFAQAGYQSVGAVELDPSAAATFAANFGAEKLLVGSIQEALRLNALPAADIIIGGPPCQGFSALGSRDAADDRNGLWRYFAQAVQRLQPRAFLIENVDRFLRSPEYSKILWHCRKGGLLQGYHIVLAQVVNAASFGVPQNRRRTIIFGVRGRSEPLILEGLVLGESVGTVGSCLKESRSGRIRKQLPNSGVVEITTMDGEIHWIPGSYSTRQLHIGRQPTELSLRRYYAIPEEGNWKNLPTRLRPECWRNHSGKGMSDVMGRLVVDRPSVTIRTEFFKPEKGRYLHPWLHRPITHYEAAKLQSFPDNFEWCGSRIEIARQIGNAVPPAMARGLAEQIATYLSRHS
jgi:DNA (cytosine-5)-methyltransferase 1